MQKQLKLENGTSTIWNLRTEKYPSIAIKRITANSKEAMDNFFWIITRNDDGSTLKQPFRPGNYTSIYEKGYELVMNIPIYNCELVTIEIESKSKSTATYIVEFEPIHRFFCEHVFTSELTGQTYWFPIFFLTNNQAKANQLAAAVKKALEDRYQQVRQSQPMPEAFTTSSYIRQRLNIKKSYKPNTLEFNVWNFLCFDAIPELSFDEHMSLISDSIPTSPKTIAERIEFHRFPVRVIRESEIIDFKEFLMVDVVAHN